MTAATPSVTVDERYMTLVERMPLIPIRNKEHYDQVVALIDELVDRDSRTASEDDYLDVLSDLVIRYESEHVNFPEASAADLLRHLMEAHGMRPADLVPLLGSRTSVSAILSGQRPVSAEQARRLVKRFGLPTDAFLDD